MQHSDATAAACFYGGGGGQGHVAFQEPIIPSPWTTSSFPVNSYQTYNQDHQFLIPPPPPPPSSSSYGGFFNRGPSLQFAYDVGSSAADHLRIISETLGPVIGGGGGGGIPFGLQAEFAGKMTAQEIMDAKALAASKSHSEAERRRRERINNHLSKLRSLLPSTTKTDKASLLAEVIQHVKELKRQTSIIAETSLVPTEADELTVDANSDEDGRFVIKASLCCEDRTDLLPDLIRTLKALHLRTLKAEITTMGGRVKNVLFITGDDESCSHVHHSSSSNDENEDENQIQYGQQQPVQYSISSIHEALKAVMERGGGGDESSSGSVKRQRTTTTNNNNNNVNMIEQQQQHHRSL